MLRKCYCKSDKSFKKWGGRGYSVSSQWLDFKEFCNTLPSVGSFEDFKDAPKMMTLFSIELVFCPESCECIYNSHNKDTRILVETENGGRGVFDSVVKIHEVLGIKPWAVYRSLSFDIPYKGHTFYRFAEMLAQGYTEEQLLSWAGAQDSG